MTEGTEFDEEVRSRPPGRPEGLWILVKRRRATGADGGPTALAGVSIDVSERKAAEESLRRSEERLRRLVESAKDYAIFTLDADRRVVTWNSGAEAVFGYREDEILGRSGDLLFTPEDRASGAPRIEAETALREGRAADERVHLRKDGGRFYASGVLTPLQGVPGDDGSENVPLGFVKIARDLTAEREAAEALRVSHEHLRIATDAAEMGTWDWDLAEDLVRWNERHFLLFGMEPTAEPIPAREFLRRVHPDDREAVSLRLERAIATAGVYDIDFRAVRDDGAIRRMSGYGRVVATNAQGRAVRMSGVMFDVTDRRSPTAPAREA